MYDGNFIKLKYESVKNAQVLQISIKKRLSIEKAEMRNEYSILELP